MNDEDRLRALRAFDLADIPSLSTEGRQDIMETIEQRLKELVQEARQKIEPMARKAYSATKAVITAPDYEEPRANKAVLARMVAWFEAEDEDKE